MIPFLFFALVAGAVPNYDIDNLCKSAGAGGGGVSPVAGCITDEKAAKERLIKAWPHYPASARQECAADLPLDIGKSYVEMETCFQMQEWKAHLDDIGGAHVPGAHVPQLR